MALLAAAGTLPMFLFCFFAGILADRFERRRYIIVCQFWMMGVAGHPGGAGLHRPAQRLEPAGAELLHGPGQRHERAGLARRGAGDRLAARSSGRPSRSNSAGFNLARTIGPVIGQILLGLVGVFLLFAINTVTYIGVILGDAGLEAARPRRAPPSAAKASSRPPAPASPSSAARPSSRRSSPAASASSCRASPWARCCR